MLRILAVCLFVGCLSVAQGDLRQQFKDWQLKFGREYSGLRNSAARFREFQKTAAKVEETNSIQDDFTTGFTLFADMSEEERKSYMGLNLTEEDQTEYRADPMTTVMPGDPSEKYWEMGPVRFQSSCGSCWAQATVGTFEGLSLKNQGIYREFSEQTLLDCTYEGGSRDGCDGGFPSGAVKWTSRVPHVANKPYGYLPYRADNEYRNKDGVCTDLKRPFPNALTHARPLLPSYNTGYRNDAGLQHALATEGPVTVLIFAGWTLQLYQFGTYTGMNCCGKNPQPNHAVTAAGYNKDHWYIKNSWGKLWGYSGYLYLSRATSNTCAVSWHRKSIDWRINNRFEICHDVPVRERTACKMTTQSSCQRAGCCWDSSVTGNISKCFKKGKITIFDTAGHRRVFFGSVPDFTDVGFEKTATWVQVDSGVWTVYGSRDYKGTITHLRSNNGRRRMDIQSVRIN